MKYQKGYRIIGDKEWTPYGKIWVVYGQKFYDNPQSYIVYRERYEEDLKYGYWLSEQQIDKRKQASPITQYYA